MGLREQKREQTRRRLASAASRLFAVHGYEDTTVGMIADEAQVSARTFFRYFESKDAVVGELGSAVVDLALSQLPPSPAVRQIMAALGRAVEQHAHEPEHGLLLRLMRESSQVVERMPLWRRRYADRLAAGLAAAEGLPEATFTQRVQAHAAVHSLAVVLDECTFNRPDARVTDVMAEAIDALA